MDCFAEHLQHRNPWNNDACFEKKDKLLFHIRLNVYKIKFFPFNK